MATDDWDAGRAFAPSMPASQLWRIAEELNVKQCALLLNGYDPTDYGSVENWGDHQKPHGYMAARDALSGALRRGSLKGVTVERTTRVWSHADDTGSYEEPIPHTIDPERSKIDIESLIEWLEKRGVRQSFFSPVQGSAEPYLDPSHERYAPKLAAAVAAWKAVGETLTAKQSPKQQILKWLRENAARFGLSDDDGKPNERGIEEIAKVANWAPGGGAPRSMEARAEDYSGEPSPF